MVREHQTGLIGSSSSSHVDQAQVTHLRLATSTMPSSLCLAQYAGFSPAPTQQSASKHNTRMHTSSQFCQCHYRPAAATPNRITRTLRFARLSVLTNSCSSAPSLLPHAGPLS